MADLLFKGPIQWLDRQHSVTKDKFWIRPGKAKNPSDRHLWLLTPEKCLNTDRNAQAVTIKPETKAFICSYMLDPEKKAILKRAADRNALTIMATAPVLSLFYFMSVVLAMLLDVYVVKKITAFNKKEAARSYLWLT